MRERIRKLFGWLGDFFRIVEYNLSSAKDYDGTFTCWRKQMADVEIKVLARHNADVKEYRGIGIDVWDPTTGEFEFVGELSAKDAQAAWKLLTEAVFAMEGTPAAEAKPFWLHDVPDEA